GGRIMAQVSSITELCHSGAIFSCAVDGVIVKVRKAMNVPDQADADVEAEFRALRADFEPLRPEFDELFARLLRQQIGAARLSQLLAQLGGEVEQRFLRAVGSIDAEFEQLLESLSQKLTIVAQQALAARRLDVRAPGPRETTTKEDPAALTLARWTGADSAFGRIVELVIRRIVADLGQNPEEPAASKTPEALFVRVTLSRRYPAFAAFYTRRFVKRLGEEHVSAVLEALRSEPLRRYLRARGAMKPALAAGLQELTGRIVQIVV
ncbi:MAG: hypothetical protein ABI895_40425, partial [Deltaproteobacteria bacterium]